MPLRESEPMKLTHALVERSTGLLVVLILLVVSIGGLVEIVPLFFQRSLTEPVAGLKPYTALQLSGRDIYIREGCNNCHSQMIRPFRAETERYGHYSVAGEFGYDHPFLWGSKRTGPDLHRDGGRYSDEWHRLHLDNPRQLVPESNMPAYPWLGRTSLDASSIEAKMRALRRLGVPYSDAEIGQARADLDAKTEQDALIAYLQVLGTALKGVRR
jgi:cytochrome c oxidase cbb3-type subunit 2